MGYIWFDGPDLTFSTEGGVAWDYEKYTNDTPTRQDFSLRLAYHVTYKFNDYVSAFHDLDTSPAWKTAETTSSTPILACTPR